MKFLATELTEGTEKNARDSYVRHPHDRSIFLARIRRREGARLMLRPNYSSVFSVASVASVAKKI